MTILITHKRDHSKVDCECSLANSYECVGTDACCYLSMNYLKGKDKPNYPVPAIITEISMWRNCIMFFKSEEREPFKMWFKN